MLPLGQCEVVNQDHSNGIASDISLALIPGRCFCISRFFFNASLISQKTKKLFPAITLTISDQAKL